MFRPEWNQYFATIVKAVAERSNCRRRKVGALLVRDRQIVSSGYNGTPKGVKNCFEGGCARCQTNVKTGVDLDKCKCQHAEMNAILYAEGDTKGTELYLTHSPCLACSRSIITAGIKLVHYIEPYGEPFEVQNVKDFLLEANCYLHQLLVDFETEGEVRAFAKQFTKENAAAAVKELTNQWSEHED